MKVTLQLFSESPNPQFVIGDTHLIQRIQRLLEGMPARLTDSNPAGVSPGTAPHYIGIVVEPTLAALPTVQSLQVFRTHVQLRHKMQATASGGRTVLPEREDRTDATGELERLLIQEALDQGVIKQDTIESM